MIPYDEKIRQKVVDLRKKGKSFGQIAGELGIGKSTVGFWCKNVFPKSKPKKKTDKKSPKTKIKTKPVKKHGKKRG